MKKKLVRKIKKASTLKVKDGMPNVISYIGKNWKVTDRRLKGQYRCEGLDKNKNPISRFISTEWLKPNEFNKHETNLKEDYYKVELMWGWDVTTLFREVLAEGNRSKDVEITQMQREYKNGSWNVINPLDIIEDLSNNKNIQTKLKTSWLTWKKVLIPTGIAAILAFIVWVLWG